MSWGSLNFSSFLPHLSFLSPFPPKAPRDRKEKGKINKCGRKKVVKGSKASKMHRKREVMKKESDMKGKRISMEKDKYE